MTTWKIDAAHSEVAFKVKHLVISTVTGHFGSFDATLQTSKQDFSDATVQFEAATDSINTKNEQRDGHLKSADFFDAANHPKMTFVSTSVQKISDGHLKVDGELSIRGISHPVGLNVTYNGTVAGFGGTQVAGFEITTSINRFDYNLKWNAMTEAGGVVVSDTVKIEILAEFNSVQEVAKAA